MRTKNTSMCIIWTIGELSNIYREYSAIASTSIARSAGRGACHLNRLPHGPVRIRRQRGMA